MAEHPLAGRLVARSTFLAIKAQGQRISCPFFSLQYAENPSLCPSLSLGYTASTAGVGGAVQRNRARRRLKAAVHQALKFAKPNTFSRPLALVFVARAEVLRCPYASLLTEVQQAFKKAGVLA